RARAPSPGPGSRPHGPAPWPPDEAQRPPARSSHSRNRASHPGEPAGGGRADATVGPSGTSLSPLPGSGAVRILPPRTRNACSNRFAIRRGWRNKIGKPARSVSRSTVTPSIRRGGGAPQGLRAPGEAAHRGWAGYFCIWLWSLRIQYLSALARQAWSEAFCMSSWVTLGACSSRDGLRTSLPSRTMELAVLYGTGTLSPLEPETTT